MGKNTGVPEGKGFHLASEAMPLPDLTSSPNTAPNRLGNVSPTNIGADSVPEKVGHQAQVLEQA
jgi:hypothetical protein